MTRATAIKLNKIIINYHMIQLSRYDNKTYIINAKWLINYANH